MLLADMREHILQACVFTHTYILTQSHTHRHHIRCNVRLKHRNKGVSCVRQELMQTMRTVSSAREPVYLWCTKVPATV